MRGKLYVEENQAREMGRNVLLGIFIHFNTVSVIFRINLAECSLYCINQFYKDGFLKRDRDTKLKPAGEVWFASSGLGAGLPALLYFQLYL